MFVIILLVGIVFAVFGGYLFGFLYMRSSTTWPQTLGQWWTEWQWQTLGFVGLVEDHLLKSKNRIELISSPDRVVVLTGGNRGIGLHVVAKLVRSNYTVVLGVRNPALARQSVEEALGTTTPGGNAVVYERLDIGDMSSVRQFAAVVRARYPRIHVLINNAGIMASPYRRTVDGYEEQLAVNYLGHFLLTHELLGALRAGGTAERRARIVNVSSCVHVLGSIDFDDLPGKRLSHPPDSYNRSKLAQVLFTKHLQLQLDERADNVQVHAVHPGVVNTDLFEHTTSAQVPWFKSWFFKTPEEGARTILHGAAAPALEGKGGTYVSNCTVMRTRKSMKNARRNARLFDGTCALLGIKDFFRSG